MRRAATWFVVGALVVLGARAIVYALSPAPLAVELGHRAGGPTLPVLTVVSLALALAVSAAAVWLASLGVRERRLLETRVILTVPRLRLKLLVGRALALWLVTMPAFAYLESYVHWRQGLGWHGLHCLTGPVHRNAIPVLAALSLVAAALVAVAEHILAWMKRVIAQITGTLSRVRAAAFFRPTWPERTLTPAYATTLGARGPPLRS